jgi:hypothetical protein
MLGSQVGPDSLSSALIPAAGYNSNEGVILGAIYNRYNYKGAVRPFKNYLESSAIISTKGFIELQARYQQTQSFGRDIRSIADIFFYRYNTDVFFGIGNNTDFSQNRWEDEYYFFRLVNIGIQYKMRTPIYEDAGSQLDFQGGINTEYYIADEKQQQSSFAQRQPTGYNGGWVNNVNTGLVWENRDSEFDPGKGNRAELELRWAPDILSRYAFATARAELRQYIKLFDWLTVANKLEARHAEGEVPYWELSTLGNSSTLRGYPLNRFAGKSSLAYSLELRSWILKFPELYDLKFGAQLFTDTGRVFTGADTMDDLFRGYHQTFGVGGAMSIFNPDFILRGEIGFSEDVSRIYVGIGYVF